MSRRADADRRFRERVHRERLRDDAEDLAVASRVGEAFGLGMVEAVSRQRTDISWPGVRFCLSPMGALGVGMPVAMLATIPASLAISANLIGHRLTWVVLAGLAWLAWIAWYAAGWSLMSVSERFLVVGRRVAVFSSGAAEILRGEPQPRVLRWPEVETVIMCLDADEGPPETSIRWCTVRGAGTEVTDTRVARALAVAAHRALAPRFVSSLLEDYQCGKPVISGNARIGQEGVTLPDGERLSWTEITSVTMRHASQETADVTTRIDIAVAGEGSPRYFDPSRVPNGIFLAHLIAHAAARNGVRVDGYRPPQWG